MRAVVFHGGIAGGNDFDFVGNEVAIRVQIRRAKIVVAGLQRHVALLDEELILVKFHLRRRLDIAADIRREIERLARLQTARNLDALDEHFRRGDIAQRHGKQLHASFHEPHRGRQGAARSVVAIAQEHEAALFIRGENRAREIKRALEIRRRALFERGPFFRSETWRGRLPDLSIAGKSDHARVVARALFFQGLRHEITRRILRRWRNARRLIDRKNHGDIPRRQPQPHARERADEQEQNHEAHRKAQGALERRQVRERAALAEPHERHDHEQRQEKRMRQFEHGGFNGVPGANSGERTRLASWRRRLSFADFR